MVISDNQFREIHSKFKSDGGFTVDPKTGAPVTSGISVATKGNEAKFDSETSTPQDVKNYHAANTERWAKGKKAKIGGWVEPNPVTGKNEDYLDTPSVFANTGAGHTLARGHAIINDQIASWNIDKGEGIYNPFNQQGRQGLGFDDGGVENEFAYMARKKPELAMKQPEIQGYVSGPGEREAWGKEVTAAKAAGRPEPNGTEFYERRAAEKEKSKAPSSKAGKRQPQGKGPKSA